MKNNLYLLIGLIACIFITETQAQDLAIHPTRVVFDKNQIKTTIELTNTGTKTKSYTVSFVQKSMDENGKFIQVTEPGLNQMFSDNLLRIYPRRVTLLPGEGQIIILQRKRNIALKDGEYRSHLFFRATEEKTALSSNTYDDNDDVSIGVSITPIFGFSIPIIVRSGKINVTAKITDLTIPDIKKPTLNFTLNREGNVSTFGDLVVEYLTEAGEYNTIGVLRGVAVYTTIKKRFISLKLQNTKDLDLTKGSLKVSYIKRDNKNTEVQLFDVITLLL
jgi:hypothetical protein|tara:strand:- start:514 stop:1341 length:828 start_codon:yes stop_codon:yes gene_type:complete